MNLRDLWLVMSIFFVQAIRHNLMPKKSWLYVLVVPYGTRMLILIVSCSLLKEVSKLKTKVSNFNFMDRFEVILKGEH